MKQIMVAMLLGLCACAGQTNTAPSSQSQGAIECPQDQSLTKTLVVFGDSQAQGMASAQNGCYSSFAYMSAKDDGFYLDNQAKGGSTLLAAGPFGPSQHDMIYSYKFTGEETILWVVGFNDVVYNQLDPDKLATFEADFQTTLAYLTAHAKKVYIGTVWVQPSYLPNFGSADAANLYAQTVRDLVAQNSTANLIDVNAQFHPLQSDIQSDLVHLNQSGQQKLTDIIQPNIL